MLRWASILSVGALRVGLGLAAVRAMRADVDYDPWSDDALGY